MSPIALLGVAGLVGLFAFAAGKRKKTPATIFPGVPDSIAFKTLGLQARALQACPDREEALVELGVWFGENAELDPEGTFITYTQQVAQVCPGIQPEPGDDEIGRESYQASLEATLVTQGA